MRLTFCIILIRIILILTGLLFLPLGLNTIEEKMHEETAATGASVPRNRGVHFSEVPEVPPPPSSPQEEDDRSVLTTPLTTPVIKDRSGHVTVLTNQNTVNTREPTLTSVDLQAPQDRNRDSTMGSTPEPWPAVNEADFDITPSSTKLALHSDQAKGGILNDSSMAVMDPMSERSSMQSGLYPEDASQNSNSATKKQDEVKKAESPGPPPPSPEPKDKSKNAQDIPKSGGRRPDMSRESVTMTPLMEGDEEGEITISQGHVKTIVVSVPPLGTAGKPRNKNNRTVDTFVSIDIPAVTIGHTDDDAHTSSQELKQEGRVGGLATTVEESAEDVESNAQSLNTRDVPLSAMSSLGDPSLDGHDSMSDMTSAGVAQSLAGNVSPSSTIPDKGQNVDLKAFIDNDQNGLSDGKISERSEALGEEEVTENGGDHEGFKQELREELERLQTVEGDENEQTKVTASGEEQDGSRPEPEGAEPEPEGENTEGLKQQEQVQSAETQQEEQGTEKADIEERETETE